MIKEINDLRRELKIARTQVFTYRYILLHLKVGLDDSDPKSDAKSATKLANLKCARIKSSTFQLNLRALSW